MSATIQGYEAELQRLKACNRELEVLSNQNWEGWQDCANLAGELRDELRSTQEELNEVRRSRDVWRSNCGEAQQIIDYWKEQLRLARLDRDRLAQVLERSL